MYHGQINKQTLSKRRGQVVLNIIYYLRLKTKTSINCKTNAIPNNLRVLLKRYALQVHQRYGAPCSDHTLLRTHPLIAVVIMNSFDKMWKWIDKHSSEL